jgi:hypothetical protein
MLPAVVRPRHPPGRHAALLVGSRLSPSSRSARSSFRLHGQQLIRAFLYAAVALTVDVLGAIRAF